MGTLLDFTYLAEFFLVQEIFQTKVVEKIKTHILCSLIFFFFENRAVCEIMWKNIIEPRRPQMTIWRMRISSKITKATYSKSECETFVVFPRQQWLYERAAMLRHKYSDCLVCSYFNMKDSFAHPYKVSNT
jgi:hypothetical protein